MASASAPMMLVEDVFVFLHSSNDHKSMEWSVYAGRVSMEDNVVGISVLFLSACLLFYFIFLLLSMVLSQRLHNCTRNVVAFNFIPVTFKISNIWDIAFIFEFQCQTNEMYNFYLI